MRMGSLLSCPTVYIVVKEVPGKRNKKSLKMKKGDGGMEKEGEAVKKVAQEKRKE